MDEIKAALADADPFSSWWPFIISGIVFLITTVRMYMGGQVCPNTNPIRDQVVIVTGASGGIGKELCKELVRRSAHVIMACRDMDKGDRTRQSIIREIPGASLELLPLDLRSFDCVRRFVREVQSTHRQVDVLINNAGIIFHPNERTADGFETHLQCNYLGHFLLTQLLLPLLKQASQGRIINVSAHGYTAGKMNIEDPLNTGSWAPGFHARDAFSHSKLAVVMATRALAGRLCKEYSKVTVNVCSPGLVRGTDHLRYSPIMKALFARAITYPWMWLFMKTPYYGAQTMIRLATDPTLSAISGEFFNDCEQTDVSELAKDDLLAEKLYEVTLRMLNL
ncbi:retinol dehydrogenase 12 [Toxorhynchites rutilus septentrionalis]|uniref:retinol dehydrogenase 12 n=1 Tax=Toxorhynchites rutilus septentrionalis TaxID=329112 RepID=UPI002479866B|nr:retinol dehydrogenase 12 [Toxorhynchites rutilus septentrionalis]XP_055616011.1 retinol dehydrogenase 12 [Toxorhynchites rutilus septentrionalis]